MSELKRFRDFSKTWVRSDYDSRSRKHDQVAIEIISCHWIESLMILLRPSRFSEVPFQSGEIKKGDAVLYPLDQARNWVLSFRPLCRNPNSPFGYFHLPGFSEGKTLGGNPVGEKSTSINVRPGLSHDRDLQPTDTPPCFYRTLSSYPSPSPHLSSFTYHLPFGIPHLPISLLADRQWAFGSSIVYWIVYRYRYTITRRNKSVGTAGSVDHILKHRNL